MVVKHVFDQSIFASLLSLLLFVICIAVVPRQAVKEVERKVGESICFILGEDKEEQTFYSLAADYFTTDSMASTNKLIRHVRSVEELVLFLNAQENSLPWHRIELVVHGNVWSGLSVDIKDGGERAYPKELLKALAKKQLPVLDGHVIDSNTIVNVWGCGIGNNPIMNLALNACFTDEEGERAEVNASKKFVVFKRKSGNGDVKLLKASYWPYFFRRGYRPGNNVISRAMADQYPNAPLDFKEVLRAEKSNSVYEEQFHIPISWTVIYDSKESRPSVDTWDSKERWIRSQPSLMKKITDLQIPFELYTWTVNKIIHTDELGQQVPAIKAIGMSTVLCFLDESDGSQG